MDRVFRRLPATHGRRSAGPGPILCGYRRDTVLETRMDGKHRNRNNYMQFAMTPEDGKKYVVYYPEGFKDDSL